MFGPRITENLFFAIQPDAQSAAQAARLATRLRSEHGLAGRPFKPERLHVTLRFLGGFAGLPEPVVAAARQAGSGVVFPPFEVMFDCVASFGRGHHRPLVLRGGDGTTAVAALAAALDATLGEAGFAVQAGRPYVPHMTLLYDDRAIGEQAVEPVRWTVNEFRLVRSLVGRGVHLPLASWPLA